MTKRIVQPILPWQRRRTHLLREGGICPKWTGPSPGDHNNCCSQGKSKTTTNPSVSRCLTFFYWILNSVPLVAGAVEGTGSVRRPNILASGENLGRKSRLNALPIAVAVRPSKTTALPTVEAIAIVEKTTSTTPLDTTKTTEPLVVFTTTPEPPTTARVSPLLSICKRFQARAFAIRNQNRENEFIQVNSLSRGRASELLNEEVGFHFKNKQIPLGKENGGSEIFNASDS